MRRARATGMRRRPQYQVAKAKRRREAGYATG
jgi:hypothetical protein